MTWSRFFLLPICLTAAASIVNADGSRGPRGGRNQIVVSPHGPDDGGDFGPNTPGTKTSGIREALLAAKEQAKDVYLAGGSWTAEKTTPVVYNLGETLHVPWMQNFRLDSGHCVLNYTPKSGDAVVFDSQMSCSYRFGLIVSLSDGAVVRMKPTTAGPDRFKVITSTEFVFNALVGGGGAWPGGEAYNSELDTKRRWIGTGLWLDADDGVIDANKITVLETVGCDWGLRLSGAVTRNSIEEINIHLCANHVLIGDLADKRTADNRIEAFMDSQGIEPTTGCRVHGIRNLLTLSTRATAKSLDLILEKDAADNLIFLHSPFRVMNHASLPTNRVIAAGNASSSIETPALPPSGKPVTNVHPFPVQVLILAPGKVTGWRVMEQGAEPSAVTGPFFAGQTFVLNPGESVEIECDESPQWRWKAIR